MRDKNRPEDIYLLNRATKRGGLTNEMSAK